jgi:hypothetical protein
MRIYNSHIMNSLTSDRLKEALGLLSALLEAEGAEPEHLVIIGGSALIALNLVSRATQDVDIMADVDPEKGLVDPRPMSVALVRAARKVAMELTLDPKWLNTGPADQLRTGLPEGFISRLSRREIGSRLIVYYPGRFDLIHLKLFAVVDQGSGRHREDLKALRASDEELLAATRWVLTQDAGEVFPMIVNQTLKELGVGYLTAQL